MYRANVKKTNDPAVQYAFAIFMFETAQEATQSGIDVGSESDPLSPVELTKEARGILQALADRSYPFAQYYLADGYASGVFNKGKVDNDKAFPLFVSASKHGHAEAGYRAALCYEYGWGTRVNGQKAVQFYRQSASKNHPGAMTRLGRACLMSDLGLEKRYREGITWLKRASESADPQYNQAPYELGLMHESGYGADVFKDESYAVQLFTQAAELGHVEANHRLGEAYEHGRLSCPRDPALSVHFYNGAAAKGHAPAMMALCAWYMVGVDGFLPKDENEAYEWAKKAAVLGSFLSLFRLSPSFLVSPYRDTNSQSPFTSALLTTPSFNSQAYPKPSTQLATLRNPASAAAATRSRPTSGTFGPQTTARSALSNVSLPFEPQPPDRMHHRKYQRCRRHRKL